MSILKNKILQGIQQKEKRVPLVKKKKGTPICCNLYQEEMEMIERIKERGLDHRLVITPTKIIRIGLAIVDQLLIEKVCKKKDQSQKEDKFSVADNFLGKRGHRRHKYFTFSLDEKSVNILESVIEKGLDHRVVLSKSEIIRTGIDSVDQLNSEALKEHFLKLEKDKNG